MKPKPMFPAPIKLKNGDSLGKIKAKTKYYTLSSARVAATKDKKFLQVEAIKEEPFEETIAIPS